MSDKQATQDPQLLLGQLLFGKQMTYCLSGVARLGVADHMNTIPMAVEEIAAFELGWIGFSDRCQGNDCRGELSPSHHFIVRIIVS